MSGDLGRRPIFLISTASHDLQCSIYQPGRPLYHGSLSSTMVPAEKVRPQFLSLRHPSQGVPYFQVQMSAKNRLHLPRGSNCRWMSSVAGHPPSSRRRIQPRVKEGV
jgi:hypothetical protein